MENRNELSTTTKAHGTFYANIGKNILSRSSTTQIRLAIGKWDHTKPEKCLCSKGSSLLSKEVTCSTGENLWQPEYKRRLISNIYKELNKNVQNADNKVMGYPDPKIYNTNPKTQETF